MDVTQAAGWEGQGACYMQSLLRVNKAVIYTSHIRCVFSNLLLEDYLLHNTNSEQVCLLFYQNEDSVVIGRNQALFAEMDIDDIQWKIVRRFSGGGAVFHDAGNINYSVIMPRSIFDRRWAAEMVCEGLRDLNSKITLNGRSDICLESYKCGGSAYRIIKDKAYHHGTLLLSADLSKLKRALTPSVVIVEKPSVQSVVSKVVNFSPIIDNAEFIDRVSRKFIKRWGEVCKVHIYPNIDINLNNIIDPKWIINRGPPYSFLHRNVQYTYSDGVLNMVKGEESVPLKLEETFPQLYDSLLKQQKMLTEPNLA